jgi:hypothetical protein
MNRNKKLPQIQVIDMTKRSQNHYLIKNNQAPIAVVMDDHTITQQDLVVIEHEVKFRSMRALKLVKPPPPL